MQFLNLIQKRISNWPKKAATYCRKIALEDMGGWFKRGLWSRPHYRSA